jgi:phosphoribosyl-ATP pyrophosphohydrolase/phosphoribosyl-AMP cyclohydrolase
MSASAVARRPIESETDLDSLLYSSGGLVTVVTQDSETGTVLMVAHADRDALSRSLATGEMHYHSRRRGLWRKGETSGNTQRLVSLSRDCDGDAVLARVVPNGPACHEGSISCFGEDAQAADRALLLDATIRSRASEQNPPSSSYTRKLLDDENLRLKKLGEESAELIAACAQRDCARAVNEAADLYYHMLVALRSLGIGWLDVLHILTIRAERNKVR